MNTNRYTEEMRIPVYVAIALALLIWAMVLVPTNVRAITFTTPAPYSANGLSTFTPYATTTATSTKKMTRKERRAYIAELKKEVKRLERVIKALKKSL